MKKKKKRKEKKERSSLDSPGSDVTERERIPFNSDGSALRVRQSGSKQQGC